ncbi:uncharacterized protein BX663DRAFT_438154 [Cokeromyces recurvatus]|uniref:uncharacterized protein n=1 Tax=Cokeromyces recurvatus TaxID=90255 RepID=UPI00221E8114|nr:uncharacterized protein BX663DRAFT_438154 [Cokeromyces recurvatus]KAI7900967.1 hypothetical protein BX663DRAFT_438154 [Cokeromyces recurvatus]
MGKKDNILPSPVNGLEFDFEGPSADYLIDTSHIYNRTIYQDVHAKKEEWTVIDKSEAKDYFPIREQDIQLTIGIQEKKTTVDLPTFGSIKLDDHFEYKRGFVLNTGGSIWGLGFVPKSPPSPQEDTKVQYLAVGGYKGNSEEHIEMNQRQPTGAYKNCIQIWRMILSVEVPYEEPVLDLCLLHDYGVIFDLRWCPYGVYEDNVSINKE